MYVSLAIVGKVVAGLASYSDYSVAMKDYYGKPCRGLLYGVRHIILTQGCYGGLGPSAVIRITHHDVEIGENYTVPYYATAKSVLPMVSHPIGILPHTQSFNLMFLKLNRDALFPSRLALATRDYTPEGQLVIKSWYRATARDSLVHEIGTPFCSDGGMLSDEFGFCGLSAGCASVHGGAGMVSSTNPVFYAVDPAYRCGGRGHYYHKIGPIRELLLAYLGSLG